MTSASLRATGSDHVALAITRGQRLLADTFFVMRNDAAGHRDVNHGFAEQLRPVSAQRVQRA